LKLDFEALAGIAQGVVRDNDLEVEVRVRKHKPRNSLYDSGGCRECAAKDNELSEMKNEAKMADWLSLFLVLVAACLGWLAAKWWT
jgi:hypothetical protein